MAIPHKGGGLFYIMNNYEGMEDLNLKELPDPDMTGATSWCENCAAMNKPDDKGQCVACGNKIAHVGLGSTD